MRSPPDEGHKERSPDLREQDEASGIEALPGKVNRYGIAKKRALDVAKYAKETKVPAPTKRIEKCGEYLAFRHYFTVDEVRLHAARFCKVHLLCPLCAIRRGSKALSAYLPRYEAVRASRADLVPFLVTLTVKDGPDLAERFEHLHTSMRELWKRRARGRGSAVDDIEAGVWSYEVKKGKGSGEWHPHLHMVALAARAPDQAYLAREWKDITGDSFIVDVRPIDQAAPERGFIEVFKYALKFSDMSEADTLAAWLALRGCRLVASVGLFRGVEIPDQLTDEPLDDLPFVEYFFRYFDGAYSLCKEGGVPDRATSN
jgi:plasmid rolling circle replication initiator protein Rep